jgi:hypothetical protein
MHWQSTDPAIAPSCCVNKGITLCDFGFAVLVYFFANVISECFCRVLTLTLAPGGLG